MARAVKFEHCNAVFKAAPGDEANVYDLDCHFHENVVTSCWELSADELAEIILTRRVWLQVSTSGPYHPSLITGSNPFRK